MVYNVLSDHKPGLFMVSNVLSDHKPGLLRSLTFLVITNRDFYGL